MLPAKLFPQLGEQSLCSRKQSLPFLMIRQAAEYGQPCATAVHPSWHFGFRKHHGKLSILDSTLMRVFFMLKHCAAARRAATNLWIQQEIHGFHVPVSRLAHLTGRLASAVLAAGRVQKEPS